MKQLRFCILFALMLCLLLGCSKQPSTLEVGEPVFADFSALDIDGNAVNQTIFHDHKLTMVNIWATFCSPCIREMPDLAELNDDYGKDFQVVGIVIDVTDANGNVVTYKKASALDIIDTTNADYLHLLPSPSLNKAYLSKVQAVPETIFVDQEGNQIGEIYVGSKTKAEWKKIIDSLLDQTQ